MLQDPARVRSSSASVFPQTPVSKEKRARIKVEGEDVFLVTPTKKAKLDSKGKGRLQEDLLVIDLVDELERGTAEDPIIITDDEDEEEDDTFEEWYSVETVG